MSPKAPRHGRFVALIGPDGCGKSTVADGVIAQLEQRFGPAEARRFHLRPGLIPPLARLVRPWRWFEAPSDCPVTDPHGSAPSSALPSLGRLLYYAGDYVAGYPVRVFPHARLRSGLVLFERYYYDFVVDPRRARIGLPTTVMRSLMPLIPRPDVTILLSAPAEVIHARKQELPIGEIARQVREYRALVDGLRGGHHVDVSRPVDQVVREVCRLVLEAGVSG